MPSLLGNFVSSPPRLQSFLLLPTPISKKYGIQNHRQSLPATGPRPSDAMYQAAKAPEAGADCTTSTNPAAQDACCRPLLSSGTSAIRTVEQSQRRIPGEHGDCAITSTSSDVPAAAAAPRTRRFNMTPETTRPAAAPSAPTRHINEFRTAPPDSHPQERSLEAAFPPQTAQRSASRARGRESDDAPAAEQARHGPAGRLPQSPVRRTRRILRARADPAAESLPDGAHGNIKARGPPGTDDRAAGRANLARATVGAGSQQTTPWTSRRRCRWARSSWRRRWKS